MSRIINVLLGLDQTLNAMLGGRPRETISGTVGRALAQFSPPLWAKIVGFLIDGVLGKHHCIQQARIETIRRAESA
jgi:hypothetical protein